MKPWTTHPLEAFRDRCALTDVIAGKEMVWRRFLKNQLIRRLIRKNIERGNVVVDVGSGSSPYRVNTEDIYYVSLDLSRNEFVNILGDAHNLPFRDKCANVVICTEVLEHCKNPSKVIGEIFEVLKDDCTLILSFPFIFPAHSNYDYWRFTVDGIRLILKDRFKILEEHKSGLGSFYFGVTIVARKWSTK